MKKPRAEKSTKAIAQLAERSLREVASVGGGINADWPISMIGSDADVWQNAWACIARVRDLFMSNPLYQSYRDSMFANVFGSEGILLRMRVKETEDRIVQNPEEKTAIKLYEERRNRVGEWFATRDGREWKVETMLRTLGSNGSSRAQIKVGEPDVFANALIERRWLEWQRREFCDVRGTRNYKVLRQLRLIGAVRDGDFFIRTIQDVGVNKFGFTLQLVSGEWCDRWFNTTLPNGNEVRMGIEYQFSSWGLGKAVAYYFIKRQPNDWQFSIPGAFNFVGQGSMHERVPAEQIIHYARPVDADATRPPPWVASTIPKARQLDQYELAEVVAARSQACKTGWLYSDIVPDGGMADIPNPTKAVPKQPLGPGDIGGLPFGVKYQSNDPTHPNGNFENFRKGMVRSIAAGLPASNYSTLANDYEAINFSAGRLQRLDCNEVYRLFQTFDIDTAEIPIFERWLYMALVTGAVPLPLAKMEKFNRPAFQARSWRGIDEVKEATAAALRVANHQSNDYLECAASGLDLDDVLLGQAEANILKEKYGLNTMKTVEAGAPAEKPVADEEDAEDTPAKPKSKKARSLERA